MLATTLLDNMSPPPSKVHFRAPVNPHLLVPYVDLSHWDAVCLPTTNVLSEQFIACPNTTKDMPTLTFDSDSFKIGVDTHATACMSPVLADFDPMSL